MANIIYIIVIIIALPFSIKQMIEKEVAHILIPIILSIFIGAYFGLR